MGFILLLDILIMMQVVYPTWDFLCRCEKQQSDVRIILSVHWE